MLFMGHAYWIVDTGLWAMVVWQNWQPRVALAAAVDTAKAVVVKVGVAQCGRLALREH